jgi:hypothetical protein
MNYGLESRSSAWLSHTSDNRSRSGECVDGKCLGHTIRLIDPYYKHDFARQYRILHCLSHHVEKQLTFAGGDQMSERRA